MADTTLISVRVPQSVARRLARLAKASDRSMSYVAGQAIEEFLALQEWQVAAVHKGIAAADAGKLQPHDAAGTRLAKWKKRGA